MDGVGVLDTPSTSTGNSFSFLFTVAFHIFVFLGSCLSMIMLLPQVYMILKQKKLKRLVAAIALFKQASQTTAVPVQHNTVQTTKVICHDPWVSFVLTLLTILGIVCYMYKHVGNLPCFMGISFQTFVKCMFLCVQGLILSKSKLLVWEEVQAFSK